jgi:hypothetical protein
VGQQLGVAMLARARQRSPRGVRAAEEQVHAGAGRQRVELGVQEHLASRVRVGAAGEGGAGECDVGRQRGRGGFAEVVAPVGHEQPGRHLPEGGAQRGDRRGLVVEVRRRDREAGDGAPGQLGAHALEQRRPAPDPPEQPARGFHGLGPRARGAVESRLDVDGDRVRQRDAVEDAA